MLFKLALKNIKKSIKDYSIYFFTLVVAVTIFYVFNSVEAQESMIALTNSKKDMIKTLVLILNYVSVFVSIILGFLIIYSNNFLIKRRKKEIGLYQTLGMSKRKVSTILVIETLIVGAISLVVGLLLGVGLSQVLSTFTAKLFEADMSSYKFVFSSRALVKTIIYFGIIFLLVMVFNIVSLSRYKLIDLINANKKTEKIKLRNKYVTIISFILTFCFLGYAYKMLFDGVLIAFDKNVAVMIVCGSIGTFLLFFSMSGVLLSLFKKIKKTYYNGLNMFVLKQVSSKINTSVASTTIISLMLLLTIGILSGSMSMASAFNTDLKENNLTDFTMLGTSTYYSSGTIYNQELDFDKITNESDFNRLVKDYKIYNTYESSDVTIDDLLNNKTKKEIYEEYGQNVMFDTSVPIMSESDYKDLMKLFKKDYIDIKDDEYLILANVEQIAKYYKEPLEKGNKLNLGGTQLKPAQNKVVNTALQNYNGSGNDGVIVVSDKLTRNLNLSSQALVGNYVKNKDINKVEEEFLSIYSNSLEMRFLIRTKLDMEASSIGMKAILTFLGLYLGIIFAISSATVLAIGQLSESSDNKERYSVLRKIGADEKMIKRALITQIAIAFGLPLLVALIHSFFGLRELNSLIKLLANINLASNIAITALFIVIVYGGYFLATYLCSKNVIKED